MNNLWVLEKSLTVGDFIVDDSYMEYYVVIR